MNEQLGMYYFSRFELLRFDLWTIGKFCFNNYFDVQSSYYNLCALD